MYDTKSKDIRHILDSISTHAYGLPRSQALEEDICVCCKGPAIEFKDDISRKEYSISALCQVCQDETFKDV